MLEHEEITHLWEALYGDEETVLKELLSCLEEADGEQVPSLPVDASGAVYCLYPDSFHGGLDGIQERMEYFRNLGVRTLWLLPPLESPGLDQGFDISDYRSVGSRYGGNDAFARLLGAAREAGIQIIFDIAINHTSDRHPWFVEAACSPLSPYRDYYHWADNDSGYAGAEPIFKGMVQSNWTWHERAGAWYLHRFYPFQPDLNFANPRVAFEMVRVLAAWRRKGVAGFRMDAAALLWKREGTSCENLPETHLLLKLIRACLDSIAPGTLLLAEANLSSDETREYFGDGDECRAAYHFPLMPELFLALLDGNPGRLPGVVFPDLPMGCSWFTFLRIHDEMTLATMPAGERKRLVAAYAKHPSWLFRDGQAVSGRLFGLLDGNPDKVILAYSLLFSLPGTPVVYYGDEIAMSNNDAFMDMMARKTGFPDSRFLHRGPFDEERAAMALRDPASAPGRVLAALSSLMGLRNREPGLFAQKPSLRAEGCVLVSERRLGERTLVAESNCSPRVAACGSRFLGPLETIWELDGVSIPGLPVSPYREAHQAAGGQDPRVLENRGTMHDT
ncbi:MAG: alpha-amylase family glycosyl hydrolase [Spirochaetes bacterium]|nr:alpha-amylase family glycosyl hydrolase [Spirochaetota bacterium]